MYVLNLHVLVKGLYLKPGLLLVRSNYHPTIDKELITIRLGFAVDFEDCSELLTLVSSIQILHGQR